MHHQSLHISPPPPARKLIRKSKRCEWASFASLKPITITVAAFVSLTLDDAANAQTISSPTTSPITLSVGTLQITSSGTVDVTSSSLPAIRYTGTANVVNSGIIRNNSTGSNARGLRSNTNNISLSLTNNNLIRTFGADAVQVNAVNTAMSITNFGDIIATGGQAIDWADIQTATNELTNNSGGEIRSTSAEAVILGKNGMVENAGLIVSQTKDAVVFNTGGVLENSGTIESDGGDAVVIGLNGSVENSGLIDAADGHAITGGTPIPGDTVNSENIYNDGQLFAWEGSGIDIDGVSAKFGTVIDNDSNGEIRGWAMSGDADGVDVDGLIDLANAGIISGTGNAMMHEGVATGGGYIYNSGTIYGDTNGIKVDGGNNDPAVAAVMIENYGVITGFTDYAIQLIGIFDDQVFIDAVALGSAEINGDIDLGEGNDVLILSGGTNLTINGSVYGGDENDVVSFVVPTGETFTYNYALDFSTSGFENLTKEGSGTLALSSFADNILLTTDFGLVSTEGDIDLGGGNDRIAIKGGTNVTLGGMFYGEGGNDTIAFDVPSGETLSYSPALNFGDAGFENLVKQGTGTLAFGSSDDQIILDANFGAVNTQGSIELGAGDDAVIIIGGNTNVTLGGTVNGGTNTTPSGATGGDTIIYDVPSGQAITLGNIINFERLVKRGPGALYLGTSTTWYSVSIEQGSINLGYP